MGRRAGMMLLALGSVACQPVDDEIFARCVGEEGAVVDGNDPRLSHECGEPCDSDWCGCEPCRAAFGSIGYLAQGTHQLRIVGGVSGVGEYTLTVRLESGEVLAERSLTQEGLFEESVPVDVPSDCAAVELEWVQHTAVCSRFYEVIIEPP